MELEAQTAKVSGLRTLYDKTLRILAYFKPYWKLWLGVFFATNFHTALSLASPLIVKVLIDDALLKGDLFLLNELMLLFILLSIASAVIGVLSSLIYTKVSQSILADVRNGLFKHLESMDAQFFYENPLGDILSRMEDDIGSIEEYISLIVNSFFINILNVVFILAICLYLDWRLVLFSFIVIPLLVLIQKYFGRRINDQYKVIREREADLLSFLQEKLSVVPTIKLFSRELYELEKLSKKGLELIGLKLRLDFLEEAASSSSALLISATLFAVLWVGGLEVLGKTLTIGSLIAIYAYIARLYDPIGTLVDLNISLQTTLVSVDRVFAILNRKPKVSEKPGALSLEKVRGEIELSGVSFEYERGKPVLKDISFKAGPGEVLGVVGPTGSGKSTVVQLLARLYDPTKGAVRLDGHDLRDLSLETVRGSIGLVTQDVILFDTSIRENISYGKAGATQEEIERAAIAAGMHDFIASLPEGYDTIVGERGAMLSGGEKQRVAIARVLLKDPKIIIFDEATSALDTETEMRIQAAIQVISGGRTVILISHRLSAVKDAGRLLVLGDGAIAEQGTFTELLEKRGVFYRSYEAQFGGLHGFESDLAREMERGSVCLVALRVRNLESVLAKHKQLSAEGVSAKIAAIARKECPEYPSYADYHQKDLFFVGLPRRTIKEAEELCSHFVSAIRHEARLGLELQCTMASTEEGLRAPDALMNAIRKRIAVAVK